MKPKIKRKSSIAFIRWLKDSILFNRIGTPVNQLMEDELRYMHWPRSPQRVSLRRYVRMISLIVPIAAALIITVVGSPGDARRYVALLLMIPTVLLGLLADLYYMRNGLNSADIQASTSAIDSAYVPVASGQALVAARNGIAQVRNWRVLAVEMGLRVTVSTMLILDILLAQPHNSISYDLLLVMFTGVLITFILEPVWRMRTTTAIGVALVGRCRSAVDATLIALGVIICLRVVQFLIMFSGVWMVSKLIEKSFPFYTNSGYSNLGYLPIALSTGFGLAFVSLLMWAYFRAVRIQAEKFAVRPAADTDTLANSAETNLSDEQANSQQNNKALIAIKAKQSNI